MTGRILSLLALLILISTARAEVQWTLTTADFHTRLVTLKSIDSAGVHVAPIAGGTSGQDVIALDHFLDLNRPLSSAQGGVKFVLHLVGDDRVGGEPIAVKGNDLVWSNPTLGEISLPMKQLLALTRPGTAAPDSRRRDDVVILANGDTLHGIITDFAGGKVTVQTEAGNSEVPTASVSQINFAAAAGTLPAATGFRVRFEDGSSLVAGSLSAAGEKVELAFSKSAAYTVDLARISSIEQVNGPVSWLSSRPAVESIYIPYMGAPRTGAARMNHNWTGQDPIRFGSQVFAHGIGVHSYSRLSWELTGKYESFRTRYAIDTKDANTRADVTVRILLDDKVVHEAAHVRAGALSPVILIDLAGAKKLTLEVDYGDNLDTQDRLNWIDPALLKSHASEIHEVK